MTSPTISEATTITPPFPIFKGAIYNTAIANNTAFFGTDLTPTYTPTAFYVYFVGNTTGGADPRYPLLQRKNGANTMLEGIFTGVQYGTTVPAVSQTIVGPSDSINFIFGTGMGSVYVVTMLVIEIGVDNISGIPLAAQM